VDLATDPDMIARGDALKAQWFAHPTFLAQIEFLWTRIEESLYSDHPGQAETIAAAIETALLGLAKWLDEEQALLEMANRRIRFMLLRLFLHRRVEIGSYIARVVETWDASTLVSKLELQVGKDLQYVRIKSMEPWSAGGLRHFPCRAVNSSGSIRARSSWMLARPYIARLSVFSLLIWPSGCPLLHFSVTAFLTASRSRLRVRENCCMEGRRGTASPAAS